jgi:hypothetical protein
MTPFDAYFEEKIAPALKGAPENAVKMARQSAAEIWNAALRTVAQTKFTRDEFPPPCQLPGEIREQIAGLEAKP